MADLSPPSEPGAVERAQLMLVGALSLAIVLVALALLLNSAIFTQSLATRGSGLAGGADAAAHRETVERAVGETIEFANGNSSSYSTQTTRVQNELPRIEEALAGSHARDGRSVTLSFSSRTRGTRLSRSSTGTLDAYTLTDLDGVRSFRLNLSRSSLTADTTDPNPPPPSSVGSLTSPFRIDFVGPTDEWSVTVYRDDEGSQTVVAVYENTNLVGWCTDASGSHTVVDVTAARVAGEHCMALEFFDDLGTPFDLEFNDLSITADGKYEYVVAKSKSGVDSDVALTPPATEEVLYSVTVETDYRTPAIAFDAELTAVPEGLR